MKTNRNHFCIKFNPGFKKQLVIILNILLTILLAGCNQYTPEQEAIIADIQQQRTEKDEWMKSEENSPLPEEDKANFAGLQYYPVDLSLRFEGSITRYDSVIPDTIIGTKGDLRPSVKYGYFPFTYRGKEYKLEVYKILRESPEYAKYLFLGFNDASSGHETYGGGRYIDMTENEENFYLVDFNLAYNPYCAYNPRYSCAIPPAANRLPFKVTAGEKIFKEH
jgi:uncharacterized protein (DUF1684 family)